MDKHKVDFHIASDDYFGTLATTLDLMRQYVSKHKREKDLLERLRDEFLYLQTNYIIRRRNGSPHRPG